jgi:threonine dehydrogenase-like Zn-dependent dehydrogenase
MTQEQGADKALVTVGIVDEEVVSSAFDVTGKGGVVVVTGLANQRPRVIFCLVNMITPVLPARRWTETGSASGRSGGPARPGNCRAPGLAR